MLLVFQAMLRAAEIISQLLKADEEQDRATVGVYRGELAGLAPLLGLGRFDRQALNQALAQRGTASREVA